MILFHALVVGLVAYRLYRIPAKDSISDRFRDWLYADAGAVRGFFADLLSCPWCIGFWWSGAAAWVFADVQDYNPAEFALVWLAGSAVCGLLARLDS